MLMFNMALYCNLNFVGYVWYYLSVL